MYITIIQFIIKFIRFGIFNNISTIFLNQYLYYNSNTKFIQFIKVIDSYNSTYIVILAHL